MTATASTIGFKVPSADLHRKSPRIFFITLVLSVMLAGVGVRLPLFNPEVVEKTIKTPPVIIQLENIPETRHVVTAPAPRLAIPLEVDDDVMLDDVTIESTMLDMTAPAPPPVISAVREETTAVKQVEEEIFEFFAVQEPPVRTREIVPEYPDAAKRANIQGTVYVRALVNKAGGVDRVEVLKGPAELHQAAIDAALKTRFTPAKQNDMPVPCWMQLPFRFVLE